MRSLSRDLVLVAATLAVVLSVRLPHCDPAHNGPVTRAKADIDMLEKALRLYRLEHRRYPTTDEGLAALTRGTARFPDGYVEELPEADPWGRPYLFESDGREFRIASYGADGVPGGEGKDADITTDEDR